MIVFGALIGWLVGEFIIGGILYSLYAGITKRTGFDSTAFAWLGRVIGIIGGMAFFA